MGTNFYLMSRNKKLMREHFAVETEYDIKDIEYAIVDEPYLGCNRVVTFTNYLLENDLVDLI